VAAILAARLLHGRPPLVFEDGLQSRDFVHVSDVVQAILLALERPEAEGQAINIGTGKATTISELARLLAQALGCDIEPKYLGKYRAGDIRHCVADISKARDLLGFKPLVSLAEGLEGFVEWVKGQPVEDLAETATRELEEKGLTR
jgi:dTDP-L-rhamnose 4-epimerase